MARILAASTSSQDHWSEGDTRRSEEFPVLDELDLKNMLLTMYAVKHLRGNVILDAGHENNTFDLPALARSLITGEVEVKGVFGRV